LHRRCCLCRLRRRYRLALSWSRCDATPGESVFCSSALEQATAALAELGYRYNESSELRSVEADAPFAFRGQAHYEKLADCVGAYIQAVMVAKVGLRRVTLPDGVVVYASRCLGERSGALVLLCGAGRVAAGQWARRLCINESLASGSVLPYLLDASIAGLSVLVLNPNARGVRRSEVHAEDAWRALVEPAAAQGALRHVALVAHSYGGVCTVELLGERAPPSVLRLLRGVALTDSVHGRAIERAPHASREFFARCCVNWVTSGEALDTPVAPAMHAPPQQRADVEAGAKRKKPDNTTWVPAWCDAARVSAGTRVHESTSEACRTSAMPYLVRQLRRAGWTPDPAGGAGGQVADAAQPPPPPLTESHPADPEEYPCKKAAPHQPEEAAALVDPPLPAAVLQRRRLINPLE
jgi:hypothetical protein